MAKTQTVTILFCDLVGSTEQLTRLGDEVKTIGDNIVVAFPASGADAVSCAVAMHRAISRLNARDPLLGLAVRIGVSSGEASNEEDDWFGTPVVEAARLESAARAGQVLVSDLVRGLVRTRGGHTFTSVGGLELKGLPEPVSASEVAWEPDPGLSALPLPSGLDRGGLPFEGREGEMAALQQAWDQVVAGESRFVLLSGEEGIGKTRLAAEFAAQAYADDVVVLYGRSETDREIPYQPFTEALRWYVLAAQPQRLREQGGEHGGTLSQLVPNLSTKLPDLAPADAADPDTEKTRLFEAVSATLQNASEQAPILLVLDDLDSASDQTLALLSHLLESSHSTRLLVVALTSDIESGTADGAALESSSRIELAGLTAAHVASLLEREEGIVGTPELAERIQR